VNLSPCISATQVFQVRGVAYDEQLADRIRSALATVDGVSEPKMFGGVAFMVHGNMTVGIVGTDLMVRVRAEQWAEALRRAHAREMDSPDVR
jgi:TfoX/Sxy family transcriptional regulator of competence genes